jgi:hypothetical protein
LLRLGFPIVFFSVELRFDSVLQGISVLTMFRPKIQD